MRACFFTCLFAGSFIFPFVFVSCSVDLWCLLDYMLISFTTVGLLIVWKNKYLRVTVILPPVFICWRQVAQMRTRERQQLKTELEGVKLCAFVDVLSLEITQLNFANQAGPMHRTPSIWATGPSPSLIHLNTRPSKFRDSYCYVFLIKLTTSRFYFLQVLYIKCELLRRFQ
jgi:hypothetical protein